MQPGACSLWDIPSCMDDSIVFVNSATSSAEITVLARDDDDSTYSWIVKFEFHLSLLLLSCS